MRLAESGINELQQYVDTLIIIPNQNLFRIANEKTTFADAFKMADDVLHSGVRGVTDLMVMPGLINLDFADIRSVMTEMGKAMMGTGEASGERRAIDAAEAAISNPLLDDVSMKGARGVLINITGGLDMTLFEVDEAANRIRDEVDPDANIIFGSTFDQELDGRMRVSVVATGIEAEKIAQPRPAVRDRSPERGRRRPQGACRPLPAPAGLSAQARQPTDYHHTLVASPPHPGAAQGHAPSAYTTHGHIPQSQPVQSHHRSRATPSEPHHGRQHGADLRRTAAAPCRAGSGQLRARSPSRPLRRHRLAEPQPMQHPERARRSPARP